MLSVQLIILTLITVLMLVYCKPAIAVVLNNGLELTLNDAEFGFINLLFVSTVVVAFSVRRCHTVTGSS